jgi:uncharacterized membrane protein
VRHDEPRTWWSRALTTAESPEGVLDDGRTTMPEPHGGTRRLPHISAGPTHDPDRLLFLSDGVFAIALTLLIIDVIAAGLDVLPDERLSQHLLSTWPAFAAYVVGFATILVCWVNHHRVFHYVTRSDSGLPWVNGVMLLLVAAVPLPTAILAKYLTSPEDQRTAYVLYGLTCLLMDVALWCLCSYTLHRGLADPSMDPDRHRGMMWVYRVGLLWTALAVAAVFVSVYLAIALWLVMFVVYAFPAELAHALHLTVPRR